MLCILQSHFYFDTVNIGLNLLLVQSKWLGWNHNDADCNNWFCHNCLNCCLFAVAKVCSNDSLLSDVINNIMRFMTWNGFPKRLATKLIQKFTPRANQIYNNSKNGHQDQTVLQIHPAN